MLYWSSLTICTIMLSILARNIVYRYHFPITYPVPQTIPKWHFPGHPRRQNYRYPSSRPAHQALDEFCLQPALSERERLQQAVQKAQQDGLYQIHRKYTQCAYVCYESLMISAYSSKDINTLDETIEIMLRLKMKSGALEIMQTQYVNKHACYKEYVEYCDKNHVDAEHIYHVSHVTPPSTDFMTIRLADRTKIFTYDEVMQMVAQFADNPNPWLSPTHLYDKETLIDNVPGIYIIHNITDDRYYVGQSVRLLQRLKHHMSGAGNNHIYADYKAGQQFEVRAIPLEGSEFSNLNDMERHYIKLYTANINGYNQTKGNQTKITA